MEHKNRSEFSNTTEKHWWYDNFSSIVFNISCKKEEALWFCLIDYFLNENL